MTVYSLSDIVKKKNKRIIKRRSKYKLLRFFMQKNCKSKLNDFVYDYNQKVQYQIVRSKL